MTKKEYEEKLSILLATEEWLKYGDTVMREEEKQRRLEKIRIRKELLEMTINLQVKGDDELELLFK